MSLVKFTELPAGSIQGGDVLAVAGASSYKVSATELANFINKRVQGGTTSTVAFVETKAIANKVTLDNIVMPQLGQISTNKVDIAANMVAQQNTDIYARDSRIKLNAELLHSNKMAAINIANMIRNENYIKNPAAHNIGMYWKDQTGRDATTDMIADITGRNLEYPGWDRVGDTLTYNFKVSANGLFTIGVLGVSNAFEYKVNNGAWTSGNSYVTIGVGFDGLNGAKVSVRVNKNFGGVAFAIIGEMTGLTVTGTVNPKLIKEVTDRTFDILTDRVDLVSCGYWFGFSGNIAQDANIIAKPIGIGLIKESTSWEYDLSNAIRHIDPVWNGVSKNAIIRSGNAKNTGFIFAASDPKGFDQAGVK